MRQELREEGGGHKERFVLRGEEKSVEEEVYEERSLRSTYVGEEVCKRSLCE